MSLNLLPSEAKFQAQKMKIKAIINNFLWVIGGAWLLLVLISFGTIFFMNLRIKQLEKKYQTKQNNYISMGEEITLSQKIKYQAKVVAKVLESRFEYGKSMVLMASVFPDTVKVTDIKLNEDHNSFKISGAGTGQVMDSVEEKVEQINNGEIEGLKSAKITNVAVSKSDGWTFSVNLFLK